MSVAAIILAAGQGKRMKAGKNKQFLEVLGKPILAYTIEAFVGTGRFSEYIIVVHPKDEMDIRREILERYFPDIDFKVCQGGLERYNSVYNGLMVLSSKIDKVLIHDGARPLVSHKEIIDSIDILDLEEASVLGVKTKNTYKLVDDQEYIVETIQRNYLYSILTPQSFKKTTIMEAYKKGIKEAQGITDDSMMVEVFGGSKVKIIEGSYENIKITTPEDLLTMKSIIENKKVNEVE